MNATGNLLVRGGTVVDGTGGPARPADVRIEHGVITEIGPKLKPRGEVEIDASGAYVAPGFIESHSHFDGSMWWDPSCDPLPSYGTTSAIIGNCGLTVAPLSDATRQGMIELFCFIEDLPLAAFESAIPWSWESWKQYRAAAEARPAAINVGVFVGHQSLRTYVMGDEAWERAATDAERDQITSLLDEALSIGALGFSSTFMDTDRTNREVPSRRADDAEFDAILATLARHPGATYQFVPRFLQPEYWLDDLERMAALCARHPVRGNYVGLRPTKAYDAEYAYRRPITHEFRRRGLDWWSAFSAAPTYTNLHLDRSIMWHGVLSWHELVNGPQADKARLLADAAWRARARREWDECTYTLAPIKDPHRIVLRHSARDLPGESGLSLREYAEREGLHPSDAMAQWFTNNGLESSMRTRDQEMDEERAIELLRDPHTITGISDAGAHIQMFNGAGNATFMLCHYVRDRGLCSVEEIVHSVTGKLASHFGLADRGTIEVGQAGDITVFALDEIALHSEVRVDDVPGGSWRYTRPAGGYRATAVNGMLTYDGAAATGARPGAFLAASPRA